MGYTYMIGTDAGTYEIVAVSIEEAASKFGETELHDKSIAGVDDLFDAIQKIGDGAFLWIESEEAPDGARQMIQAA